MYKALRRNEMRFPKNASGQWAKKKGHQKTPFEYLLCWGNAIEMVPRKKDVELMQMVLTPRGLNAVHR